MKKMEMTNEELEVLLSLRAELLKDFYRYKDYKSNNNAIMKEMDHLAVVNSAIKKLDVFLSKFVEFK